LKEEALDRTLWRIRFWRGYGPVVRQTTEWMNVSVARQMCNIKYSVVVSPRGTFCFGGTGWVGRSDGRTDNVMYSKLCCVPQ
jgi:hypothetical protein